jgi:hypothetical protein
MNDGDVISVAKLIALRVHREVRANRLERVDYDCIKCAVAGWFAGSGAVASPEQNESLNEVTLRKFVEMCA